MDAAVEAAGTATAASVTTAGIALLPILLAVVGVVVVYGIVRRAK